MAKHILIAEDSENDVLFFRQLLISAGLTNPVILVRDGEDVIKYFQGAEPYSERADYPLPSVLLLDLKMPKLGGLEVLKWLQSRPEFADVLKIVVTGAVNVKDLQLAYRLGADSFITKPCSVEDITNLSRSFAEHWW